MKDFKEQKNLFEIISHNRNKPLSVFEQIVFMVIAAYFSAMFILFFLLPF